MWQWLVIAPLLAASAAYAAWRLVPGATRWRFAQWLSRRVAGGPGWLTRLAGRLERAALPAGGCESCPASRMTNARDGRPSRR
ncbi:MAG TPA: DUF6587 family protein [Pelomicrobium sp.]|nr:DUF6587 family protein [Pelomicrobium sp.]